MTQKENQEMKLRLLQQARKQAQEKIETTEEAQKYLALISKKGDIRLKAREELSKKNLSSKEIDEMVAQTWAAHGKPNPNKTKSKNDD